MNILSKLSQLIITAAISLNIVSAPITQTPTTDTLGTAVPTTPALYDGYLSSGITKTDTSMTLSTGVLRNGASLTGFTCFTIDVNQPTVEYVCGTASGTSVTGMMRGVDVSNPNATSSSLAYAHRRFASVSISDYPTIQMMVRKLNGTDSFDSPLTYSSSLSTSTIALNGSNLVNVSLLNSTAFSGSGAVVSTETSGGYVTLASTTAQANSVATYNGVPLVLQAKNATSTYNAGSASNKVIVTKTDGQIDNGFFQTSITPTGAVIAFASTTPPSGWLIASGQSVSTTTYSSLYNILRCYYGCSGPNFTLPNYNGRTLIGSGIGTTTAYFVSRSSNTITIGSTTNNYNNEFQTGQAVLYLAPSGAMSGLTTNTTYYIIRVSNNTIQLATSLANAQNGTAIILSSDGTGVQTFAMAFTNRVTGETGGEENHAMSGSELLAHTHSYNWTFPQTGGGSTAGNMTNNAYQAATGVQSAGGNQSMNNMQPFAVVTYIIKY